MNSGSKEKFIKIYANLPMGIRQEIILVLDENKPITWNVAFNEIYSGPVCQYKFDVIK